MVASDAFFPFADGLEVAIEAGAVAVIQPGGSMRDEEVIAAADKAGIAMAFTGMRHFNLLRCILKLWLKLHQHFSEMILPVAMLSEKCWPITRVDLCPAVVFRRLPGRADLDMKNFHISPEMRKNMSKSLR